MADAAVGSKEGAEAEEAPAGLVSLKFINYMKRRLAQFLLAQDGYRQRLEEPIPPPALSPSPSPGDDWFGYRSGRALLTAAASATVLL